MTNSTANASANQTDAVIAPVFGVSKKPHRADFAVMIQRVSEIDPFTNRRKNLLSVFITKTKDVKEFPRTPTTTDKTIPWVVMTVGWNSTPHSEKEELTYLTPDQVANLLVPAAQEYDNSLQNVSFFVEEGITVDELKKYSRGLGRALILKEIPVGQVKAIPVGSTEAMGQINEASFIEQPAGFSKWITGMDFDDLVALRKGRAANKENFYVGNVNL